VDPENILLLFWGVNRRAVEMGCKNPDFLVFFTKSFKNLKSPNFMFYPDFRPTVTAENRCLSV